MEKFTPKRRQIIYCDTGRYRKTWCGPYAIATVCGMEYEPAYRMARQVRGKRHAKGITCNDFENSCKKFGVTGKWHTLEKRQKCENFLKSGTLKPNKVYVINITRHFFILDTRDYTTIDNQVPEWIAAETTKHGKKLVVGYFEVDNPKFDAKAEDTWLIEPLAASSN